MENSFILGLIVGIAIGLMIRYVCEAANNIINHGSAK